MGLVFGGRLALLCLLVALLSGCHALFPFSVGESTDGASSHVDGRASDAPPRLDGALDPVDLAIWIDGFTAEAGPQPDTAATDAQLKVDIAGDGPPSEAGAQCVHPAVAKSCSLGWCSIPSGCFLMGSPLGEPCREPFKVKEALHEVTLTHDFEIHATEVTREQFQNEMSYDPSKRAWCAGCPVEDVSWHEAVAFCNALSVGKGLLQCYACSGTGKNVTCSISSSFSGNKIYSCPGYRLPTEAEWEYAFRAGSTSAYHNGANDPGLCSSCASASLDKNADLIGWYCANSSWSPQPVAQKLANDWGLFDMAGNVYEWCHDPFHADLGAAAVTDPVGPAVGSARVARGGAFNGEPGTIRAAYRIAISEVSRKDFYGFRCVRTLP